MLAVEPQPAIGAEAGAARDVDAAVENTSGLGTGSQGSDGSGRAAPVEALWKLQGSGRHKGGQGKAVKAQGEGRERVAAVQGIRVGKGWRQCKA